MPTWDTRASAPEVANWPSPTALGMLMISASYVRPGVEHEPNLGAGPDGLETVLRKDANDLDVACP
jgi:hypothetical protein